MNRIVMFCTWFGLCSSTYAYKTDFSAIHYGLSIGGAYAGQSGLGTATWDVMPQLIGSTSTYNNPSGYKTPLRLGFFYRHPSFTLDTYLRYFTNYQSGWTLAGAAEGAGNSRYKGIGGGLDFEMPILANTWLRAGLVLNIEYLKNRVVIAYNPAAGSNQSLETTSSNILFGGGAFLDTYIGDLWSLGLRGLYGYDLGGVWRASKSATFLGNAQTAGSAILDSNGDSATSNFSHWRVEALLRLAFY